MRPVAKTLTTSESAAPPVERTQGRIQRIYAERGFGFIRCLDGPDTGQDYFFHMSGLDDCGIEQLEEGSLVDFEARRVAKGKRAEHIQRVPEAL